jgi:lipid II:glycine glycyltransferase (peptidoglycan interpeptide bridge formation enzyme)
MQPREIFVIDITKSEEELLAQMKPKTRYNIRLAEKHGVRVFATREKKYQQAFFDLIEATARRKEISPHPKNYYATFFDAFPPEMCQLFVAEYQGRVLVANIFIMYQGRAIYLHGGSSSEQRDVMAPFLLQWEQIKYAKEHGCTEYDFGGVRTLATSYQIPTTNSWGGITRFKLGFSPSTTPTIFPGSYDMILDPVAYRFYNLIRRSKELTHSLNIFK